MRERECVRERVCEREKECLREREKESLCVRERERECVCRAPQVTASQDSLLSMPTLETTLGQMAPPKSGHPLQCYLNQVTFPER